MADKQDDPDRIFGDVVRRSIADLSVLHQDATITVYRVLENVYVVMHSDRECDLAKTAVVIARSRQDVQQYMVWASSPISQDRYLTTVLAVEPG